MATEFVHLHIHSDYSTLDGACKVDKLAERCVALGMSAVALTDHGNICGAIEFFKAATAKKLKPLVGCEFYVAPGSLTDKTPANPHHKGFHLIVLATDLEGYRNLCRLNTIACLDGYYFKPRIDKEVLRQHHQGLLGCSACLGGEIATRILENNPEAARRALGEYVDIFGRGNFYLELQDHGLDDQRRVNLALLELSQRDGVPLVATNDAHYLLKEHSKAHEVLLCIGTQKTLAEEHFHFESQEFYVKSGDEMAALFTGVPEALRNTLEVAERCTLKLDLDKVNHYPVYEPADGSDRDDVLRCLALRGLPARFGFEYLPDGAASLTPEQQSVVQRMEYELGVIKRMKFTSYYLVVWDFLDYARRQGIPVGPGRGSGAGSLVAYLLYITHIDPLRYGLLFERFLNPERISPPDFDIDLCERRRNEVIEYVRGKYGADRVAQIGTFGTLKAKAVFRDVARVLGHGFNEVNPITKLIPEGPKVTLEAALDDSEDFRRARDTQDWVRQVLTYAEPLESLNRNMSIHAAGVIIGDQPLTNLAPLAKGANDETITQYPAPSCESLGLLKMDFLGLRTLTVIHDTCELIQRLHGVTVDPDQIPFDDPRTYRLLCDGHTAAVFQLESGGMRDLCRRWGVRRLEDIVALIALYRPGPMQFIDDFLLRRQGLQTVDYDVPAMKEILAETEGIMVYQEQVMQVVQAVAGFTLGQADILRRAMGKKKDEMMGGEHDHFVTGCVQNGVAPAKAEAIWLKIKKFAKYGFNKSHSAAYAFLAYRTAWLKANYPVEFMTANLNSESGDAKRLAELIRECRQMGIPVLPPDVNASDLYFAVDGTSIRFGLAAVKGVAEAAAGAILRVRGDGPFTSLGNFCERVGAAVSHHLCEALIKCGAFDFTALRRAQMLAMTDGVIKRAQEAVADRAAGQATFFELLDPTGAGVGRAEAAPPDLPEWPAIEKLNHEKELLGFYVSGHPMGEYEDLVRTYALHNIIDLAQMPEPAPTRDAAGQLQLTGVRVAGLIAETQTKYTKDEQPRTWAIFRLEDRDAGIECLAYSDCYKIYAAAIVERQPVFVEGIVVRKDSAGDAQLRVIRVLSLAEAQATYTKEVVLHLTEPDLADGRLDELRELVRAHPGPTNLVLGLALNDGRRAFVETGPAYHLAWGPELAAHLTRLFGDGCYRVRADKKLPIEVRTFRPRNGAPAAAPARPAG